MLLLLDVVVRTEIKRGKCNVHVVVGSDHRLILRLVYACKRPNHLQIEVILSLLLFVIVLRNDLLHRRMMLLV